MPQFAAQVHHTKRKLLSFLIGCKEKGARICGYGAPGKGNTLLNYCGIGTDFLDFTVDRNPYKHGRYTPGMHIPIHPVDAIDEVKAGLPADPALEPEERDRRADAPCRRLGRQVHRSDPERRRHRSRTVRFKELSK